MKRKFLVRTEVSALHSFGGRRWHVPITTRSEPGNRRTHTIRDMLRIGLGVRVWQEY